ncbi:MAG: MotA/TolQ/ExbB proton channel family protein [Candidatus Zixiibacteriota bacterium]
MLGYLKEGGWMMYILTGVLGIGVIIAIVKLWFLLMARINTKAFIKKIQNLIDTKGVDEAINETEKTRGPVSAVVHSGLTRADKNLAFVERAMENEAAVQMGHLEKGMTWLAMVIAIAPMLGFLGTVIGMIEAFRTIKEMKDIVPSEVAGGIQIALLTTAYGLVIAVPMQIFYNLFVSMIDGLVVEMEDSANVIIEHLLDKNIVKN